MRPGFNFENGMYSAPDEPSSGFSSDPEEFHKRLAESIAAGNEWEVKYGERRLSAFSEILKLDLDGQMKSTPLAKREELILDYLRINSPRPPVKREEFMEILNMAEISKENTPEAYERLTQAHQAWLEEFTAE